MVNARFVHLRLHSEYSVSDGIVRLKDVCSKAAGDGMPALALTDLANLFGMVKFYQAARSKGLKPIIGCDVWVTQNERDHPCRVCCWCRTAPVICVCAAGLHVLTCIISDVVVPNC